MTELDVLRQQLAEAQALIEASQKQEIVAWKYTHIQSGYTDVSLNYPEKISELDVLEIEPLFAATVVAPDVLKDAGRYRWLISDKADSDTQDPEQSLLVDEVWKRVLDCGGNYTKKGVDTAIDAAMGEV